MSGTAAGRIKGRQKRGMWDRGLWSRWVVANSAGETVGLGGAFAVGLGLFAGVEPAGLSEALAVAAAAVLAGTLIEGIVFGTAQWIVLRHPLPDMRWRAWVLATMAGALMAWSLGMLPSTLASLGEGAQAAPAGEMGGAATYGLAALMGFALGSILGFPQWLVLRGRVRQAALWVPANALAWAPAMALIFFGAGLIPAGSPVSVAVLALLLTLAAADAAAIHGLALVWLLRPRRVGA